MLLLITQSLSHESRHQVPVQVFGKTSMPHGRDMVNMSAIRGWTLFASTKIGCSHPYLWAANRRTSSETHGVRICESSPLQDVNRRLFPQSPGTKQDQMDQGQEDGSAEIKRRIGTYRKSLRASSIEKYRICVCFTAHRHALRFDFGLAFQHSVTAIATKRPLE